MAECQDNLDAAGSYLDKRGIARATAEKFRLGVVPTDPSPELRPFIGRLAVPSYSRTGAESLRFKLMEGEGPKMLPLRTGDVTRIYWPHNLFEKTEVMAITEGEPDAWVAWQCGIPAVGVVGVNNWKKHHPRLFAGFSDVLVFGDNDEAGRKFAKTVVSDIPTARAVIVPAEGQDLNDYYLAQGGFNGGTEAVRDLGGL
ncbi:toprim domain-containing protein [Kineococcus sp. NPDC059986]|uniref:toprim domain-containing protein n=1 Tax=Kineococcus sp. NPDC059986 TaxID=3155538 RepID=UPI00344C6543